MLFAQPLWMGGAEIKMVDCLIVVWSDISEPDTLELRMTCRTVIYMSPNEAFSAKGNELAIESL